MIMPAIVPDAHTSSCLLLTLNFVVLTCSQEQSSAPAGIRLSVQESEFNRFSALSIHRRTHFLKTIQFDNLTGHDNDLSWTLTNIHGSNLTNMEIHATFGDDGNVTTHGTLRNCSLQMDWSMSEVIVIGKAASTIQSQGKLEVDIGSVSIQYTFQAVMKGGSLALRIGRCSLEISQLSVKSVDSNLNQFVQLMASSFSPDLKKLLNDSVCRHLTESTVVVQNMIASLHLKQSYSKFGENVTIDASFLSMNMSKGAFHTLHKGDVCFNGKCLPVTDAEFSQEPPSDDITVDIKNDVLDNAIILLKETKILDFELTFRTIIEKKITWLNMNCWNTLCIENFFPDVSINIVEKILSCVNYNNNRLVNLALIMFGKFSTINVFFSSNIVNVTYTTQVIKQYFFYEYPEHDG